MIKMYTIYHTRNGFEIGIYEGNTPQEAIDAACKNEGYLSENDMVNKLGRPSCMYAVEYKD